MDIVIVGAGVIGLTTALEISTKLKRAHKITVVADHDPESQPYSTEYTSPWAGAHFRPYPSKNEHELREFPYTRITAHRFKELVEQHPESSIKFIKGREYFENPDELYKSLAKGYTEDMTNFKVLDDKDLPEGSVMGTEYDAFVLNPPVYLQFLYRKLKFEHDVKFVKARLGSLKEAIKYGTASSIIINCSGKGLQWDGGYDPKSFPIRGQTLLINAPKNNPAENVTVTHQSKNNEWTFFIPRPLNGGFILGGTKQPHDTYDGVREEDTQALLKRGAALYPYLMKTDSNGKKYFDIVRVNVGFRPAREGGSNISVETHEGHTVVNGYGFAGSGYEMSFGAASAIYKLLVEQPKL